MMDLPQQIRMQGTAHVVAAQGASQSLQKTLTAGTAAVPAVALESSAA